MFALAPRLLPSNHTSDPSAFFANTHGHCISSAKVMTVFVVAFIWTVICTSSSSSNIQPFVSLYVLYTDIGSVSLRYPIDMYAISLLGSVSYDGSMLNGLGV